MTTELATTETATKPEITIVIPSIKKLEDSSIIASYEASDTRHRLRVQFVYLQNLKSGSSTAPTIETKADYDLVTLTNTRFFDSAEENIFRLQDVVGLLKPYVFIVGEHDLIDWAMLERALEFRAANNLDVMGWNLLCRELQEDGSDVAKPALIEVADLSAANGYVKMMLGGQSLSGQVGYLAMLSVYGTLDWAAYIGNQLWSRRALAQMLQYSFPEYIYAHVYKQAQFFAENEVRYGVFAMPVIHRISNDFLEMRRGKKVHVSPRQAQGASNVFWVGHLACLNALEDDSLFLLLSNTLRVCLAPDATGAQSHQRMAMILNMIEWGMNIIRYTYEGRSFYFPDQIKTGSLQDLSYAKRYFTRLLLLLEKDAAFASMPSDALLALCESVAAITQYLHQSEEDPLMLEMAYGKLDLMRQLINTGIIIRVNEAAFAGYLRSKKVMMKPAATPPLAKLAA